MTDTDDRLVATPVHIDQHVLGREEIGSFMKPQIYAHDAHERRHHNGWVLLVRLTLSWI
jgi:hypothetical protein